ncbi:MAG: tetratricopeptide repeat protein, partial [Myxococcota bacterium]
AGHRRPEPRPEPRRGPTVTGRPAPSIGRDPSTADRAGSQVRPLVDAGRSKVAAGAFDEALRIARELASLADQDPTGEARQWSRLIEGEALIGLGDWEEALAPLETAVDDAKRLGATEPIGRALIAFGRACHHTGRYDRARTAFGEALTTWEAPPLERSTILRFQGDIALRRGEIEVAELNWSDALDAARRSGSHDAEARALRGMANCTAIRGHYPEALEQLVEAYQMLGRDADPHVVAGILIRIVELDNVIGRYGPALARVEALLDVAQRGGLRVAWAEAMALEAEALAAVGQSSEAAEAAAQAISVARHLGVRGLDAGLRAARVCCDVGRPAEALAALDEMPDAPPSLIDETGTQLLAVRARAVARTDPALARELANDALNRPSPLLAIRAARIRLDAALALHDTGADSQARAAVKRGLKSLQGSGNKGLKLELLIAMYQAAPDARVVEAAARTALRVMEDLPEHAVETFRRRAIIGDALARWKEQTV